MPGARSRRAGPVSRGVPVVVLALVLALAVSAGEAAELAVGGKAADVEHLAQAVVAVCRPL